jgi:hypothetical protein
MPTRRQAAAVAGVLSALALAAPIAGADAATTPAAFPTLGPLPAFGSWPAFVRAFGWPPVRFLGPPVRCVPVAEGATVIGSAFNCPTVGQTVNGSSYSSVIGSP